ncbi:fluoride efflux transporter CrcB [Hephaestia sp. GCM10023244]|uniref:fluoride efflux transporter CrcB n=1 Tax=unclassified Hephaestia TaxID=2631281 RepID=UPI0020773118|nr:fluoride efflux transporter CrcB [Hephaestia sp. MAHUQ-44]MCM8729663.1 fluoride efflux transporter CrcB [Hephaestia sp. MAHUQ-44]
MLAFLLVILGGALGAGARHLVGRWTLHAFGPGYPWGILTVNLVGGFVMGLLVGVLARQSIGHENLRLFMGVGVLGGFTTFSSFSLDVVTMIERGDWSVALGYVLVSVIGSVLALFGGLAVTRAFA